MLVAVKSFGCQLNQAEGESLKRQLVERGFRISEGIREGGSSPVAYVANSCCVTSQAAAKLRKNVRRIRRKHTGTEIIFTGCYAKHLAGRVKEVLPEVDTVFPDGEKEQVPSYLETNYRPGGPENRLNGEEFNTRKFYKIQDGCQEFCTYCIVPYVRPELWSRDPGKIKADVEKMTQEGDYNEIVLTGAHLGAYGEERKDDFNLQKLLAEIARIDPDCRIRLSSLEPQDVSPQIIDLVGKTEVFCNHLFLPLQSGSDRILKRMGRKYRREKLLEIGDKCYEIDPQFSLNSDLMVGFPGETKKDFEATVALVDELRLANLHVFRYSERPGTPAAGMEDKVHSRTAKVRSKKLREKGKSMANEFAQNLVGRRGEVVVEKKLSSGQWFGYSERYFPVWVTGDCCRGESVKVDFEASENGRLFARKVGI